MDPIYHYLNRIPRVISVQGYIDDNTIAGPGNGIEWVNGVQKCYQCCRTAGFQIDPHSCWQALRASHRGKPSALDGTDYAPISSLLALECECRCKTALVINCPLPSWVLRQLDKSGFGAHCVQGVATSLGLVLLGRAQLADKELWKTTTHPTTLKQINPKAAEKFIHRLRLFKQPVLSVVAKSIVFNTFSQSVVLYTTSYFGTATEDLQMLRAAAVDLLLGRSWIRHDLLAYCGYVFRWSKIAPLLDPG